MAESKPDIAALRQEIRAQRERLIDEKIEKGFAVRGSVIVVGVSDPNRDYRAVTIDNQGREVHPPADVAVIITGVPRAGRDSDEKRLAAYLASRRTEESDARYEAFRLKPIEAKPPPPLLQHTPEPRPSSSRCYVRCTVRGPDPDEGDPGQIIEASYTVTGNLLSVFDEEGRALGTAPLRPGDDAEVAARQVIREKQGKHLRFYDPISYRGHIV